MLAVDQRAAQDDVGRQVLHDDERLDGVEMENLRGTAGVARFLTHKRVILKERTLERQRPAIADEAHIGQGLLDDGRTAIAFDDEDEVEIAIADFAHFPMVAIVPDTIPQGWICAEPSWQGVDCQCFENLNFAHLPLTTQCACPSGFRRLRALVFSFGKARFCQLSTCLTFDEVAL